MKLFLISQDENRDYDTYDSAVVCAPDAESARLIDPAGQGGSMAKLKSGYSSWCSSPDKVHVQLLGDAISELPVGVVCASFNAG